MTIYPSHNQIMPMWPASQGFSVLVGADHATVYRLRRTADFEDRTGAYDLREKAEKFLCFHQLFRTYGHQLFNLRSTAARSVAHFAGRVKPTW